MNAIDDLDNLVGFDTSDDCCAHGGWFVASDKIVDSEKFFDMTEEKVYEDYHLDTEFFEDNGDGQERGDSEGGVVIFRMVSWGDNPPLYLHLYNCHNGYYGKGFSYNFGGKLIEGGI